MELCSKYVTILSQAGQQMCPVMTKVRSVSKASHLTTDSKNSSIWPKKLSLHTGILGSIKDEWSSISLLAIYLCRLNCWSNFGKIWGWKFKSLLEIRSSLPIPFVVKDFKYHLNFVVLIGKILKKLFNHGSRMVCNRELHLEQTAIAKLKQNGNGYRYNCEYVLRICRMFPPKNIYHS